ncbi:hypothetical protein RclHR1_09800002 [Rhizophagus clarus]|uniref:F-box domain-containing protein n=1 Tax=Rhizophagus clarus TaxID=94130 RepID=A0A2Z6S5M2_9GLOM|nr:hypothetical protein RclHR1_09800002 [Rhizophagus clarus]GES76277.1 hypothetical protein GLOIN_2v1866999 [Rhizophagus clarus]
MSRPNINICSILIEIFNILRDDKASLFNLLLVNKRISEMIVPILWDNPFKYCKTYKVQKSNHFIIQTYIKCFKEEERDLIFKQIKEIEIINPYDETSPLLFEYVKYLNEFNIRDLKKAVILWFEIFKEENDLKYCENNDSDFEKHIIHSIMRQCRILYCLDWNICLDDEELLEIMRPKIKKLSNLTLYYDNKFNFKIAKRNLEFFKNHCQKLSSLKLDSYHNEFTKYLISFVESNNDLNELIFDYRNSHNKELKNNKKQEDDFNDLITSNLELRANFLTKVVLIKFNLSNIPFDYIENCINLEILVLRYNKGLELEDNDLFTSFNDLKYLDSSFNEWSSKVDISIIKKAGNSLSSLTIGENKPSQTINDDTLSVLAQSCPNINSLSISGIAKYGYNMVFSYLKYFRLVTLKVSQNRKKGTIMYSHDLLNYIENEESLSTLGIGKNDDYWEFFCYRDKFTDILKKHNVRLEPYVYRHYY